MPIPTDLVLPTSFAETQTITTQRVLFKNPQLTLYQKNDIFKVKQNIITDVKFEIETTILTQNQRESKTIFPFRCVQLMLTNKLSTQVVQRQGRGCCFMCESRLDIAGDCSRLETQAYIYLITITLTGVSREWVREGRSLSVAVRSNHSLRLIPSVMSAVGFFLSQVVVKPIDVYSRHFPVL